MNAYLVKPFSIEALSDTLARGTTPRWAASAGSGPR